MIMSVRSMVKKLAGAFILCFVFCFAAITANVVQARAETIVAEISIYAHSTSHAWISILNRKNQRIEVGYLNLAAGREVTVGLFGTTGSSGSENLKKHHGVWYNVENYRANEKDWYTSDLYSIQGYEITQSQLDDLNEVIKAKNDTYNLLTYNCVDFAVECWNLVTTIQLDPISTPKYLAAAIKETDNYSTDYSFSIIGYPSYYDSVNQAMVYSSSFFSLEDEII